MQRLAGRRIAITGGASGIGRATAERFAREGAAVAVLDRDAVQAQTAAESIGARWFAADVSDAVEIGSAVAAAAGALGGLDGLVNAAGIFFDRGLMETAPEIWHQTIAVNLTGTFLSCRLPCRFCGRQRTPPSSTSARASDCSRLAAAARHMSPPREA